MDKKEQINVVVKAKAGDEQAIRALLEDKKVSILLQAAKILNDIHDAEDAAQEVMISIYNNIKKLRDPRLFDAWLGRIVINTCYSMLGKTLKRSGELNIEDFYHEFRENDPLLLPDEFAENSEEAAWLHRYLNKLPNKRKAAVEMYYFQEKSYAEIAKELDVVIGAVSSYIAKGKKDLLKAYNRHFK